MVNNSSKYFGFIQLWLFSCVSTHFTYSNITRSIINIFIFIYTRGTSISITIKTSTRIVIFVYTHSTCSIISISITTFAIFLIIKLAYIVPYSQSLRTIICLPPLYLFWISSHSSIVKTLRHLGIALWTDSVKRIKWGLLEWCSTSQLLVSSKYYTLNINLTVRQFHMLPNSKPYPSYIDSLFFKWSLYIFRLRYIPWYNLQLLFIIFLQSWSLLLPNHLFFW